MIKLLSSAVGLFVLATFVEAQTPPAPQARRARPRPAAIQVTVRDQSGAPIPYAHVTLSGTISRAVLTNADGVATLSAMPDGTFRVRFECEGFVTLERDLTIRGGQPHDIEVEMTAAPPPPPAAPPQTESTPAPNPTPASVAVLPVTMSIPTFLDKNFIGREPSKESVLGCTGAATTRCRS